MKKEHHDRLDGTYTNLLRRVQNIHWTEHATLEKIYGSLPRVSHVLRSKRLQFAGHCFRATDEVISSVVLWKPGFTTISKKMTYPGRIARDTGLEVDDLGTAMGDREAWRAVVSAVSANAAT